MEPLSKIAYSALAEITRGQFIKLPQLAITALLNDFQYSWLRRFQIPYKFEMLDVARCLCYGENKAIFRVSNCKSVEEIRKAFSVYIKKWHNDDDRLIMALSFDGKKINAEWVELAKYLKASNANAVTSVNA